jgi:sulfur relay (sulfurtransferase) complex TusBCD TusD component (DsrE family)
MRQFIKPLYLAISLSIITTSCGDKSAENSAQQMPDSTEVQSQNVTQEELPLNPSRSAYSDYTFDVAIRNEGQNDILIFIMRKGAFMNQKTESINPGNTIKGSASFDINGNSKPELIACYGNSSSSGIHISEVDEIGTFTNVTITGTLPVLPELVNITSSGNQLTIVDVDNKVLATLESSDNDGKIAFTVK